MLIINSHVCYLEFFHGILEWHDQLGTYIPNWLKFGQMVLALSKLYNTRTWEFLNTNLLLPTYYKYYYEVVYYYWDWKMNIQIRLKICAWIHKNLIFEQLIIPWLQTDIISPSWSPKRSLVYFFFFFFQGSAQLSSFFRLLPSNKKFLFSFMYN